MPIIKSAKKRVRVAARANTRNTRTRRQIRETVKAFEKAVEAKKAGVIGESLQAAISAIDTAAKKNVIHKNKAARQKSTLAARAKAAGFKPIKLAPKKPVAAKKTAIKKPASK